MLLVLFAADAYLISLLKDKILLSTQNVYTICFQNMASFLSSELKSMLFLWETKVTHEFVLVFYVPIMTRSLSVF